MLLLLFPPSPFSPLFSGPFYTYQVVGVVNKKKIVICLQWKKNLILSSTGIWTRVSSMTGRDADHYTIATMQHVDVSVSM